MTALDTRFLAILRCPATREPLAPAGGALVAPSTGECYEVTDSGIPRLLPPDTSEDARRQMEHYDESLARQYSENLAYPHTQEYMAYLDRCLEREVLSADLESVAELCCGQGEMLKLFGSRVRFGVGVDVSLPMLEQARRAGADRSDYLYVQGDATRLPLADASVGSVFMLGGVHHVRDRRALFAEVARVLRPGGRVFFREPRRDIFLWRINRAGI
jgi:ubiquinone/menaquinone biosynthesis C-methylase UbiE